ncbi:MAG: hypothetical protein ACFFCS_26585 [Candidatus Hodarchaeota archaeon]
MQSKRANTKECPRDKKIVIGENGTRMTKNYEKIMKERNASNGMVDGTKKRNSKVADLFYNIVFPLLNAGLFAFLGAAIGFQSGIYAGNLAYYSTEYPCYPIALPPAMVLNKTRRTGKINKSKKILINLLVSAITGSVFGFIFYLLGFNQGCHGPHSVGILYNVWKSKAGKVRSNRLFPVRLAG